MHPVKCIPVVMQFLLLMRSLYNLWIYWDIIAFGHYLCISDNKHISVSKASVSRCIHKVTNALCEKKNDFIKFPNTEALQSQIHEDFNVYCGIPTVIGAIDGTQILIQKPTCDDWYQYLNRKSKTAINVGVSSHL